MSGFLVNPSSSEFQNSHSILNGRLRTHRVGPFEGPLSIKTVISGEAVWETDEGRRTIDPDTFLILNEGQSYRMYIDYHMPVETFCTFFQPGFLPQALSPDWSGRETGSTLGFYQRKRLRTSKLSASIGRLYGLVRNNRAGTMEADDELVALGELLLEQEEVGRRELSGINCVSEAVRTETFRQLNTARDYMLSQLGSSIKLEDVSREVGLSPFHFHRLHRQAFGETPHGFLTKARLARAARLLKSKKDVGEISLELGFESVPTFHRLFKRHIGMTPGEFRKIG